MKTRLDNGTCVLRYAGLIFTVFAVYTVLTAANAYAFSPPAGSASVGWTLCLIWAIIHTDILRGIATLAVVALGIGAMLGKVSWGLAILVTAGIAAMFGANPLLAAIGLPSCV